MDVLAGIGFGALVGCLLGFSTQSVIAGSIAAVLTIVAGFIGVAKPAALRAAAGDEQQQKTRIVAFGCTATLCFLLSYYVAINHCLEPSPKTLKDALVAAGYTDTEAKALVGAKYYGVVSDGWKKAAP